MCEFPHFLLVFPYFYEVLRIFLAILRIFMRVFAGYATFPLCPISVSYYWGDVKKFYPRAPAKFAGDEYTHFPLYIHYRNTPYTTPFVIPLLNSPS